MSIDGGLKRRKGESRDACIERLLNMHGKNSEAYHRLAQRNRDLENELDEARKAQQLRDRLDT